MVILILLISFMLGVGFFVLMFFVGFLIYLVHGKFRSKFPKKPKKKNEKLEEVLNNIAEFFSLGMFFIGVILFVTLIGCAIFELILGLIQ